MIDYPAALLALFAEQAVAAWPREACAAVVRVGGELRLLPIRNEARGLGAYRFHAGDQLAAFRAGEVVALVHSHCDAPARFSEADRREAVDRDGHPLFPGIDYLVLSVLGPRPAPAEAVAVRWRAGAWEERPVELAPGSRPVS